MKSQNDATQSSNFIKSFYGIDTNVVQVPGTGEWVCAFNSYPDFMRYRLMTDTMLNACLAQLDQECPDLEDDDPRMKMVIIRG